MSLPPSNGNRGNPKLFGFVSVAENRVELHPGHVGLGDEGLVAAGAFGSRRFLGPRGVGERMMSEIEEAPAVRSSKSLAVFDRDIHAVVFAVEISSAGWFRARAVGKGRIENACQFLNKDCALGKGTGLEIHVQILFLDVDVVIFGEARLAVVEAVGCQGCADKNPVAVAFWQLQLPVGIKNRS